MVFLYLILFVFLFILLAGVGIVNSIFRLFFGKRRATGYDPRDGKRQEGGNRWGGESSTSTSKKVFSDDDGEYIDFEEIKDEK